MIYDYVRSEIMKKFCTRPFAGKFICAMLAAAALISCFSTAAFAEEKKTPSGIAFDSIAKEIEIFEEGKNYASFETSVFCGDDVIYTGCFGYADRENNVLADEETVYEWGSVSKTMIWVSVMQLYEQGKLDLETDIRNYLPNGFLRKLKYDEPIARWLVNWRNLTYFEFPKEVSVMTMKDYQKLLSVPDLFCRKVRSDISKDLLDELDKENL